MSVVTPRSPHRRAGATAELAQTLRTSVARLSRLFRQQDRTGHGATLTSALAAIARGDGLTLGELAAIEQVQPPSMTRIVARLEEGGLVERQVDANDRRIVRVRVTAVGKRLLTQTRTKRDEFLAQRVARLTEEERELLERVIPVLEKLQDDDQ